MSSVQGIFITATSNEYDAISIDARADEFLKKIPVSSAHFCRISRCKIQRVRKLICNFLPIGVKEILEDMSDEQFQRVKENFKAEKTEKPRYLKEVSKRYFFEIEERMYYFDRHQDEAKEMKSLQKSDLLTLYKVRLA